MDSLTSGTTVDGGGALDHGERIATRFTPGTVIGGRYRIVSLLGEGGMGQVYRADDMKLGQRVALKCLPPELAANGRALLRLFEEVRIGRQISHPNVCRIHDIIDVDGQQFIAMEFIDGEDLASLLRRIGRLPAEKAALIAHDICAGLAAAHDRGIIHRDLKPANIMVDGRGRAVIADFGLAALAEELHGSTSRSGTPAYMSPEQLQGIGVTARSDIYSLGLILYEIFTGKRMFGGASRDDIGRAHTAPKPRPSTQVREIDPQIERIILRCLEEDPAQRASSVHAILAAIPGGDPLAAAVAAGETPSPDMVAAAGPTGELSVPAAWTLCTAALAALLLGAWVSWRWTVTAMVPDVRSRDVLIDRAREVVGALGYPRPRDEAVQFTSNIPYLRSVASRSDRDKWSTAGRSVASPLLFVYRGSPVPFVTANEDGAVSATDPPETVESMTTIVLDHRGRLRTFRRVPPERVTASAQPPFDWRAALNAAGLDAAKLTAVPPLWTPPYGFDSRMAWSGTYPDQRDVAIRVEAASLDGKPVFFRVIEPWTRPGSLPPRPPIGQFAFAVITFVSFVGGTMIALRNHRRGRGDTRGAIRLGTLILVSSFLMRAFAAHHVVNFRDEWDMVLRMLAVSLLRGVTVFVLYLAVEPYVRRHWPRLLISWSRLVAGRWRDSLVGRDVMIGAITAGLTLVISRGVVPLYAWLGRGDVIPMNPLAAREMKSTAAFFSIVPYATNVSVVGTLAILTLLMIFGFLFRHHCGTAFALTMVLLALNGVTGNVPFVANLLQAAAMLYVMYRFGAVAYASAVAMRELVFYTPLTFDLSVWYAPRSAIVMLLMASLVLYGFHLALAGKPLLGHRAFDEEAMA